VSALSTTEETRGKRPPSVEQHAGQVWFAAQRAEACVDLAADRFIVARAPASGFRGRLRAVLDDAVEGALATRGALPPAVAVDATIEATMADQIFRARALGARGLIIVPPPLDLGTDGDGVLGAEDSLVLGAWLAACSKTKVALLFEEPDRAVKLLAPCTLASLLGDAPVVADCPVVTPPTHPSTPLAKPEPEAIVASAPAPAPVAEPEPAPIVTRALTSAEWRGHAMELDAARGPKSIGTIERLFTNHYSPLLGPTTAGRVDAAVREVVDSFRSSFEHSYREAFAQLRVTGKRPPMVFDAPEIAGRLARLNGARKVVLLLVDGMRFDLAERVTERLTIAMAGRALPVERTVLWAALPANTPTQTALLARGAEGLRDAPSGEPEPMVERGRGISTIRRERIGVREILKLDLVEARLRTTGIEAEERLDKLADELTPILARHFDSLAPRTLVFLFGDHGFRLPSLDEGRATGPALQGGCSPEEVLVSGHAWLVDAVQ
jgi:hypothetical protein